MFFQRQLRLNLPQAVLTQFYTATVESTITGSVQQLSRTLGGCGPPPAGTGGASSVANKPDSKTNPVTPVERTGWTSNQPKIKNWASHGGNMRGYHRGRKGGV